MTTHSYGYQVTYGNGPPVGISGNNVLFVDTLTNILYISQNGVWLQLSGGGGAVGANPSAIAGPTAINGVAVTYMRSDAAPAIQLGTSVIPGILSVDGVTITAAAGVISAVSSGSTGANPSATASNAAVNGVATTFMRSDAAPAIQLASNTVFGLAKVDNVTLSATAGVIATIGAGQTGIPAGGLALGHNKFIVGTVGNVGAETDVINLKTVAITFVIDGGGSAITTGTKGYLQIPFAGTITGVSQLADQSGSIVTDIWKCTYAQFDAGSTHPVVGDSITSATPPTISAATKSDDVTLTGWTTAIAAGDVLAFNVNSDVTVTRNTITITVLKS